MNNTDFRRRIRISLANESLQIALDNNTERRLKGRASAFESLPDWKERRQRAHSIRAEVIARLDEYLAQFTARAEGNGVVVHRAADAEEAVKIVLEIVESAPQPPFWGQGTQRYTKESFGRPGDRGSENPFAKSIVSEKRTDASPQKTQSPTKESLVPLGVLHGKKIIAKSKSMVSEEVNLNHALEARGHRAVETDLGEYIVQLRGERPAHIITPAVHLRRNDVGRLFQEKLGIPYTEDIPTLTNTARKVLREVFLTADVGFSGVNFGVAETGGFCLVTNEGNGRMVTTLPRVHIALMGMERLVPTLDDLALMLSLLPRSATGQKLSVYTQLIHRPLDGQVRHIVLLDNGRSGLRASPLAESLYCIRCGACLNACPVFRELGGHAYNSPYPGPIGSVISAGLFGGDFVPLAQASSLCGACKDACPVDIDLPKLLTRVRAGQSPSPTGTRSERKSQQISPTSGLFMRIYSRIASDPRLFSLSQRFAALGSRLLAPFSPWIRMPKFTGWGYSKDLPRFAARPFRSRWDGNPVNVSSQQADLPATARPTPDTLVPDVPNPGLPIPDSLPEQFTRELTALGGQVTQTKNPTQPVIDFLASRGITRIHLEPGTLDESLLRKAGIDFTDRPDPALPVGVTGALCGLADTGSILIADGEGSPLQASLLPEIHLAMLKSSDLLPSLADAMRLPQVRGSKAAVFITGPSRTADIEMTLTIGVHGPGELHVYLVDA